MYRLIECDPCEWRRMNVMVCMYTVQYVLENIKINNNIDFMPPIFHIFFSLYRQEFLEQKYGTPSRHNQSAKRLSFMPKCACVPQRRKCTESFSCDRSSDPLKLEKIIDSGWNTWDCVQISALYSILYSTKTNFLRKCIWTCCNCTCI